MIFDFFLNFEAAIAKIFNKCKKISPKKSFWKLLVLFFPPKPQFFKLLGLLQLWREEQNSEFPKTFFGGYLFAFVKYLCNRNPKIKTKNIKNCSSILTIINHWNWLDGSPPLNYTISKKPPNFKKNLKMTPKWVSNKANLSSIPSRYWQNASHFRVER